MKKEANAKEVNVKELTVIELKALSYDLLIQKDQILNSLQIIGNELSERAKATPAQSIQGVE